MGMNLLLTSFRLSENSIPCGHRTEVWISVLVVGRKPLWTQSLLPCSSHGSLHHKTSNSTWVFLVLWVSLISPSAFGHEETLILRALRTHWDLPGGSVVKSGRPPGEGNGNPLQYSCLENSMDRGTWWATVHGVGKESAMTEHVSTLVKNQSVM